MKNKNRNMMDINSILPADKAKNVPDPQEMEAVRNYLAVHAPGLIYDRAIKSYSSTRHVVKFRTPDLAKIYCGSNRSGMIPSLKAAVNKNNITIMQDGESMYIDVNSTEAERGTLHLGDVMETLNNTPKTISECKCVVGEYIDGGDVIFDMSDSRTTHMLIAGTTGSGKSVTLENILLTATARYSPEELEINIIDPKMALASTYRGLPHTKRLVAGQVLDETCQLLDEVVAEMKTVMAAMAEAGCKNVDTFNGKVREQHTPHRFIVIDEADSLLGEKLGRDKEEKEIYRIIRDSVRMIAEMGRAEGIHLILASQKAVNANIPSNIKSNIPCAIALKAGTRNDSVGFIGASGAEKLNGNGDSLVCSNASGGNGIARRAQIAYVSEDNCAKLARAIADYWNQAGYGKQD